jgi:hypothetical protein
MEIRGDVHEVKGKVKEKSVPPLIHGELQKSGIDIGETASRACYL